MRNARLAVILGATLLASPSLAQAPPMPTLVSPSGTGASDPPTFIWNVATGATQYYLWVNNGAGQAIVQTYHDASTACSGATCSTTLGSTLGQGTYTWWIQAINGSGGSPWSSAMNFAVGQTPGTPTLISPTGSGVADPPTFTWNVAASAQEYYLWVNNGSGTPVVQSHHTAASACDATTCSVTLGSSLGQGEYTWWVQGRNAVGDGPWSSGQTFAIGQPPATPTLVSPAGVGLTSPITFTWNEVTGATQYYLWVNNGAGQPIIQTFHTAATACAGNICSVTPAQSLPQGAYTWWIQASNAVGPGPWSAAVNFAIGTPPGTPTLTSPSGVGNTSPVTFTWNEVSGATQYYLWVNDGASQPIIQTYHQAASVCASSVCSATPAQNFPQGTYTWWIQASNDVGPGPWSNALTFAIGTPPGTPVLVSPNGSGADNPPNFVWNVVEDADTYELWVNGPSGSVLIHTYHAKNDVCIEDETTCSVSAEDIFAEGSYVWWVRAINGAGPSPWSAAQGFAIGFLPGAASLISPEATQGSRPTYLWASVPNAASYYLWVNGPAGTPVVQITYAAADVCGADNYCVVTSATHLANGAHTWWIQATNAVGAAPWSSAKSFDVRRGALGPLGAGFLHSLTVTPHGTPFGFGANGAGQLGDGTSDDRILPTPTVSMNDVASVAAGADFSLAATKTGGLYAFGSNASGQFGDGTDVDTPTPTLVPSISSATSVAAGAAHGLALLADGTVRTFGNNEGGQLGDGSTTSTSDPVTLGLADVVGIAAGDQQSIAVTRTGSVFTWGAAGLLGNASGDASLVPLAVASITDAVAVAAGHRHSLVVRANGEVMAFGANEIGQLGEGSLTDHLEPVVVGPVDEPFQGAVAVSAGNSHSLILRSDGTVWAMGASNRGQLGRGDQGVALTPVEVPLSIRILAIAAGANHSMALDVEGGLWVWGANDSGQLGDGTTIDRLSPVRVADGLMTFRASMPTISPAAGTFNNAVSVALTSPTPGVQLRYTLDGTEPNVASSLYNGPLTLDGGPMTLKGRAFYDANNGSATATAVFTFEVATPQLPSGGLFIPPFSVTITPATASAEIRYTLDGSTPAASSPVYTGPIALTDTTTVTAQAFKAGYAASGVTSEVYTKGIVNTPALSIPGGKYITRRDVIATTTTPGATIRYTTNGAEPTETDEAAPGNGLIVVDRSMTLRVKAFKSGIAPSPTAAGRYAITGAIQAGAAFMVGLKADKTVWAWGINNLGQLGRGNVVTPQTSPVQTPGLTDIEAIAVGANHVIALKTGGTLVGWGLNSSGQLGISNTSNRTSPVPIPGLSNVKAIAAGDNFSMALLGNGEVWTWGNNAFSQLADGTTSTRTTPIKSHYATTPEPVQIAAGNVFSMVRFDDGTVMASGAGALGATVATSVNPVSTQLPAGVTEIFAGRGQTAFAVVTQGAATQLFGWGLDNQGQLGIGLPIGVEQTPLFIAIGKTQVGVGANQVIFGGFGAGLAGAGPASSGELGLGFSPILPASLSRMAPIPSAIQTIGLTAGANFSAALCIDGSVWTWGLGSNGQAGQGSTVNIFVPTRIAGFSLVSNTAATNDTDGDGLADGIEWAIGTDPQLADTNGDGIDDGAALLLGQSPTTLDSDGDGLTDAQEAIIGTNPYLADTDRDGVPDGLEAYPLDPTRSSNTPNPNDHTPPVITLLKPVTATPIP